ncbi:MAG: murein hydrolase activator EnvC family protein, partial [Acetobacteraceae bacterium]
ETAAPAGIPSGPIRLTAKSRPRHQLLHPVAGRMVRRWGAHTPGGPATGVSWRTAPGARVVAPCSGRVLFAAPFHGYGQLLILDCGGGYDVVIAGFARLDATVGGITRAGQAIGVLPAGGKPPKLYMELRRDGAAVDPAPWLRTGA